jgi:hypothetical protein
MNTLRKAASTVTYEQTYYTASILACCNVKMIHISID